MVTSFPIFWPKVCRQFSKSTMHVTCPDHHIMNGTLLCHDSNNSEQHELLKISFVPEGCLKFHVIYSVSCSCILLCSFHTTAGNVTRLLYYLCCIGHYKSKYAELSGSKHALNLICSKFLSECDFGLLLSFWDIWTLTYFWRTHLVMCFSFFLK